MSDGKVERMWAFEQALMIAPTKAPVEEVGVVAESILEWVNKPPASDTDRAARPAHSFFHVHQIVERPLMIVPGGKLEADDDRPA